MYESNRDGDVWNWPDGSDEEVSKVNDSVPIRPLIKQELTTDVPHGDELQRWDTTKVHDFNTDDLRKI